MFYAQIDENNICIVVSNLSGEVIADNLIQLETYDISILGKRYNNGEWEEVPQPEPEPTQLDKIEEMLKEQESSILDTAVNAEYLACLADLGL